MGIQNLKKGVGIISSLIGNDEKSLHIIPLGASLSAAAPIGSLGLKADAAPFATYRKTGALDTDWTPIGDIEGGGLKWETTYNSAANGALLVASNGYVLDADSVFALVLPAAPVRGDIIGIVTLGNVETNNVTLMTGAGISFHGVDENIIVDTNYGYFELIYSGDASTGWVLSNVDEQSAVNNLEAFTGSNTAADAAIPEYTENNVVTVNTNLMNAVDELDIEAGDVRNFIGKDGDADDLPNYSERIAEVNPGYTPLNIADTNDLELAAAKLDYALQQVANIANTGISWRTRIKFATADALLIDGSTQTSFSDDENSEVFVLVNGDEALNITTGIVFTWSGTEWTNSLQLVANQAVSTRYDFPDTPGSAQHGAAYLRYVDSVPTDEVRKIADFDFDNAAGIALSSTFAAIITGAAITNGDTVETAIAKLYSRSENMISISGLGATDTDLGTGFTYVADNSTLIAAISSLETAIAALEETTYGPVVIAQGTNTLIATVPVGDGFIEGTLEAINGSVAAYRSSFIISVLGTEASFTEKDILIIGEFKTVDTEMEVVVNGGNVEITIFNENKPANPNSTSVTIKIK